MNSEKPPFDRFLEPTKENIQEQFTIAKNFIESEYGIKLTNIELAGLRRISEKVIEELSIQEKRGFLAQTDFNPWQEIPARFVQEFYGLSPAEIESFKNEKEDEVLKEWFRRKQKSLHSIDDL